MSDPYIPAVCKYEGSIPEIRGMLVVVTQTNRNYPDRYDGVLLDERYTGIHLYNIDVNSLTRIWPTGP